MEWRTPGTRARMTITLLFLLPLGLAVLLATTGAPRHGRHRHHR